MNNLQNGVTSSQLSPQAFKNSNQSGAFQQTYNESGSGQTYTPSQVLSGASGSLQVYTGSNNQILGVSTSANTPSQSVPTNSSTIFVPFALLFLVVSAGLAIFFFKRFRTLFTKEDE